MKCFRSPAGENNEKNKIIFCSGRLRFDFLSFDCPASTLTETLFTPYLYSRVEGHYQEVEVLSRAKQHLVAFGTS